MGRILLVLWVALATGAHISLHALANVDADKWEPECKRVAGKLMEAAAAGKHSLTIRYNCQLISDWMTGVTIGTYAEPYERHEDPHWALSLCRYWNYHNTEIKCEHRNLGGDWWLLMWNWDR